MSQLSGREREAQIIRRANRAATVGRLMLGELNDWQEFLKADTTSLENLPRRNLKAALSDVRERLSSEIKNFCAKNFQGMDERKLSLLYEDIKQYRGLELPLKEFERKYATVQPNVIRGNPAHLTISISLWGLQFKFPEDELSKDLITALQIIASSHKELRLFETKKHSQFHDQRLEIASSIRKKMFAVHSAVLCSFNLLEAYLNGLAWDYIQRYGTANLSNNNIKLLEDTSSVSIREKLKKYPQILTGRELWKEADEDFDGFMNVFKPFRDSLVHPSPFSAPEKFGGYDKLRLFYRLDYDSAVAIAHMLISVIQRVHRHIYVDVKLPAWISELELEVEQVLSSMR